MFARQLVALIALGLSVSAQAATRTWQFNLQTPGTYEVHVQHLIRGAIVPRAAEATYSFQTREKTLQRNLPFYPKDDEHPVIVLIADITSPQKAKVVIAGLPQPLLQQTRVYVIDGNSRYPYEWFDPGKSVDLKVAKQIRHILGKSEQEIDLARTKLTIDKLIDPTIDIEANLQRIDAMVTEIKMMLGFGASQAAKLQTLKRYIYEPGEWNNYQPYRYDLDDPLGTKLSNKLLSHYIVSKKGNCVTMPFLFVILGQRLDIDVTISVAPAHVFAKAKDEMTGVWHNLETTSGASPIRGAWLRQQFPMSDKAIANGVYLQPLTKKETVVVMVTTLVEYYADQKELENLITLADLILEYDPKHVSTMIAKANAYYDLSSKYYAEKYRLPNEIPARAIGHYHYLLRSNKYWATKAIELGWQEWRKEDDERYLQSIKEAKRKTMN